MTEQPTWRVLLSARALRDLGGVSPSASSRIRAALDGLPTKGDIRKLQGRGGEYRLRVGDWRVLFKIHSVEQIVLVTRVVARKDAYRD